MTDKNNDYSDIEEILRNGEEFQPPTADELWKALITNFFKEFVAFCHPTLHEQIDYSKEIQFLEKELINITGKQTKGIVDILAVVTLHDTTQKSLLFHIEVQGKDFFKFETRMFRYYIRIWDMYEHPITALAIITPGVDKNIPIPQRYKREHFGTKIEYTYNVTDLRNVDFDRVIQSTNIIELLTGVLARQKKGLKKSTMKLMIYRKILESGYEVKDIRLMISFADHLMKLSDRQEQIFQNELQILEDEFKESSMILSHIEEKALKKGAFIEAMKITHGMVVDGLPWKTITKFTQITEPEYEQWLKNNPQK